MLGCPLHLNTNGTLLTLRRCEAIVPYLETATVSLDGSTPGVHDALAGRPGAFRRVLEGVERLQRAGLERIILSATVCRQNLADLPGIIGLAQALGVDFSFSYLIPRGRANLCPGPVAVTDREEYELEERLWRKCLELGFPQYPEHPFYKSWVRHARLRCPADTSLYILPDGAMYPCPGLADKEPYYLGNIHRLDDLKGLMATSPVRERLSALHVDDNPRTPECAACEVRHFCGGSCLGRDVTPEGCHWIRERLRQRLWQFQEGQSLAANVEAMFGDRA